jgi:hypothetical protein
MKSSICTYVPPCVEVVEVELESGVLTKSEAGASNEGLFLDDPFNLFGL